MSNAPSTGLLANIAHATNGPASSVVHANPISGPAVWDTYTLQGQAAPGVIALDGIRGFERKTVWDRKIGKGQTGATLTLVQQPLAEGTIETWLWLPSHFEAWDYFYADVLQYFGSKQAIVNAAEISHPALYRLNITNVVVGYVSPIRHRGKKLYSVTVQYIEWTPQPTSTIVNTPLKAATYSAPALPATPPPAVAAAQASYYSASSAHAAAAAQYDAEEQANQ